MLKKLLIISIFCCMALAKDVNIVFISGGKDTDPFWNVVKNGFQDAGKELNIKTDYRNSPTGDLTELARLMQSAISKRPDGIVVTIRDRNSLSKEIKRAIDLKIPVINVNSGQEYTKELGILMFIGMNEYRAGLLAGQKAKEERGDSIKSFVCANHDITNFLQEQRCQGFADGLGIKNDMVDVGQDPTEIQKRIEPFLTKVDAVLTTGPQSTEPVINLFKNKKLNNKPYFVAFDLSKETVNAIKNDMIAFTIDQQPYLQGYLPVIFLNKYVRYGMLPSQDEILTGPAFITKDNVQFVEEYAGKYR